MRVATLIRSPDTHTKLAKSLARDGIEASHHQSIGALVAELQAQAVAAVFVEDYDGRMQEWLSALERHAASETALIAIGSGGAANMSHALLCGADDYVVIGSEDEQLVSRSIARVSLRLRRHTRTAWRIGAYSLDTKQGTLSSEHAQVRLTPREQTLALLLFQNRGRLVSLERLCMELCGDINSSAERAVKQHAYVLRKKCQSIADERTPPLRIETIYARGYRLAD